MIGKFTFENYKNGVDKYPDKYFDIIFIDGRARNSCVKKRITKIRQDGIIILDNSKRDIYQDSIELLRNYRRSDFFGFEPYSIYPRQTSVWIIKELD